MSRKQGKRRVMPMVAGVPRSTVSTVVELFVNGMGVAFEFEQRLEDHHVEALAVYAETGDRAGLFACLRRIEHATGQQAKKALVRNAA